MSATINAYGGDPERFELWEDMKPTHSTTLAEAESVDDRGFVANVNRGELFVYPAKGHNSGKAVVICPGGAYYGLSMESEGAAFGRWLSENGITVGVLKYRTPGGVAQVPLEDARRGFDILRQNGAKWGVDTTKIGVMGFSAGGHLASTVTVRDNPSFSVLFYPVISCSEEFGHKGSFLNLTGGNTNLNAFYSNELHVTKETPPTLLLHCADDDAVPLKNSQVFQNALIKNGVLSELVVFPSGGHGWGMNDFKYQREMKSVVLNFILNTVN